ncbi:MAG: DNA-binding protein WhiA [Lachnospiraceae bacterium]|nr:DNA-binding protein WhiA [Lachnospiraceae bacterium]
MSFSSGVKQELMEHMSKARHCRLAELGAILTMSAKVEPESGSLVLTSESRFQVDKADRILTQVYGLHGAVCVRRGCNGSGFREYILKVEDSSAVKMILTDTGLLGGAPEQQKVLQRSCCRQAFIRGTFLSGGSINDPEKNYHIEILFDDKVRAQLVKEYLSGYDIGSKVIERNRSAERTVFVLYLKDGEQIVDLLSVMKAHNALMELENVRILKDMRNKINRQVNCEMANMSKTINTAVKQITDIRYLMDHGGFGLLSPELKQMAMVRLENTETPLKDLGQLLDPPVSKSGVNHRLRRLSEMADRLREENL